VVRSVLRSSPTGKYREVGAKLSKGRPLGQTLGHTGDLDVHLSYLWSWGGKEVEADGKVVINSTLSPSSSWPASEDAHDGGGARHDTTTAVLSQTHAAATLNGASIYISRCATPTRGITEKYAKLNTHLARGVAQGPGRAAHAHLLLARFRSTQNEKAAKTC
jgi:multiple sugar transport system substrate-binding protein